MTKCSCLLHKIDGVSACARCVSGVNELFGTDSYITVIIFSPKTILQKTFLLPFVSLQRHSYEHKLYNGNLKTNQDAQLHQIHLCAVMDQCGHTLFFLLFFAFCTNADCDGVGTFFMSTNNHGKHIQYYNVTSIIYFPCIRRKFLLSQMPNKTITDMESLWVTVFVFSYNWCICLSNSCCKVFIFGIRLWNILSVRLTVWQVGSTGWKLTWSSKSNTLSLPGTGQSALLDFDSDALHARISTIAAVITHNYNTCIYSAHHL